MKKLVLLATLAITALAIVAYGQSTQQTYIISSLALKHTYRVHAHSRIEAVLSLGMTVWTEEEWKACDDCSKSETVEWGSAEGYK